MALSTSITVVTRSGLSTHDHYDVRNLFSVGVATFSNFKTGTTNVHDVGIEVSGINVLGADTPIGSGSTIYDDGGSRFSGIVTATSFSGSGANLTSLPAGQLTGALPAISGANLTGIDASAIKSGSIVKVQANASGADVTGILTVTKNADSKTIITGSSVGIGTTTTAGRNAGVGTATATLIFNSTTNLLEYYNGSEWSPIDTPPSVTSINNTNITETQIAAGFDLVITGTLFKSGATVQFIGNNGTVHTSPTVTFNSAIQLTARVHTSVANSNEPYDVKVVNPSGLSGIIENALNVNAKPIWSTAAGNIITISDNATGVHTSVSATDPESDAITYSGTVGGGMSINSSGAISGDPTDVSNNTTVSFTINATSSGINTTPRTFNIVVTPHLGGQHNPATSAKALVGTGAASGNYYFNTPNGVKQLYADMSTDSGGWTMFARTNVTNNSNWNVRSDYGLSGSSPSTEFCAWDFKNNRDGSSSTGECEYLISMNNGAYRFKVSTLYLKGTNTYTNRTGTWITGASTLNTYMTQSEFNNNAVAYWDGSGGSVGYAGGGKSDVGQACKRAEIYVNSWSSNFRINTFTFNTPHSGSRCSDWCGQSGSYRTSRTVAPYMSKSQTCFSGYSPGTTNSVNITNCEIYFREK